MAVAINIASVLMLSVASLLWIPPTQGTTQSYPCKVVRCTPTQNTTCDNDVDKCHCRAGYILNGTWCQARKLGDNCTQSKDCTKIMKNTRCFKNLCECVKGYIKEGDSTCRLPLLGERCSSHSQCNHVRNEERFCDSEVCSCAANYKLVTNSSIEYAKCVQLKVGDVCSRTEDCFLTRGICSHNQICECVNGSEPSATNEICECHPGSKVSSDNQTCVALRLRDDCRNYRDCQHLSNTGCIGGKCACVSGYKEDGNTSICLTKVIGDECHSDDDCKVANSVCKNNLCSCIRGFSFLKTVNECTEKMVRETNCSGTEDCLEDFNNTVCKNTGYCGCEPKHYLHKDGYRCLFRYLGDPCRGNDECNKSVSDSECLNGACQCREKRLAADDRKSCVLKLLEGRPCPANSSCSWMVANSFCDINKNMCYCNIGYYSNSRFDECLEKRLQDPCSSHEECNTTNPHTFCSPMTRQCECLPTFAASQPLSSVTSFVKPVCDKRKIADQLCNKDEDCSSAIANSRCAPCQNASEESSCHQVCRHIHNGREGNASTVLSNSTNVCSLRTCLCEPGFSARNDGARCEGRKLREPCRLMEDCNTSIANSVCEPARNVCLCHSGFREEGRELCIRRVIGNWCYVDHDCESAIAFSHCNFSQSMGQHTGVCKCDSGYHGNDNNKECRKRHIGDRTCTVPTDCSDAVNNSYCHHGMCACIEGHYRNFEHTECHARRLHHDYCDTDRDCSTIIKNSSCKHHRCVCNSGFFNGSENSCVKRQLHDKCEVHIDCSDAINNTTCVNAICTCVSGFNAVNNDSCVRRQIYDSTCKNDLDCSDAVANSGCYKGDCICRPGHYPSENNTICLRRKLEDHCNETYDCRSVILNSTCSLGLCTCVQGYDSYDNNSRCMPAPTEIGHTCHFTHQCRRIDLNSNCFIEGNSGGKCGCPSWTFIARNRTACIMYPEAIGEYCFHGSHCVKHLANSFCDNGSCKCSLGFFVDSNKTKCYHEPKNLGDYCQEDDHCLKVINNSECYTNKTCVCPCGYIQTSAKECTERPHLPQYVPVPLNDCEGMNCFNCTTTSGSQRDDNIKGNCSCLYRVTLNKVKDCVPIQTYIVHLSLTMEAGRYDYRTLMLPEETFIPNLQEYKMFENRIIQAGISEMFDKATSPQMKDRFVNGKMIDNKYIYKDSSIASDSDVNADCGVKEDNAVKRSSGAKVTLQLNLTATPNYQKATTLSEMYIFFEEYLNASDGVLGKSALKVLTPYTEAVKIDDYDECASQRHDCDKNATCMNTLGSFLCACASTYVDGSDDKKKFPGRKCKIPEAAIRSSDACFSGNCETSWIFVILAMVLFLLIVMVFITYEIIQRKQTFMARKLYEKFGTTKIRKLRQASMQRMKERKKKKKEENKKNREEKKQKKDKLKREKSEKRKQKELEKKQRDLEKKAQKNKPHGEHVVSMEDISDTQPPTPVEIMHPTSLPYVSTTDDSHNKDMSSLPGSVNLSDAEMGYSKRAVSHIEESPV